ncbi:MAG: hypothetical protein ACKVT0_01930 [Planctomycetaceae bacterium]
MNDASHDDSQQTIEELMDAAYDLDYGPTRIALIEEAVRLADLSGDPEMSFGARTSLIDSCTMGGRPDLALVAFTWCLAEYDKQPEEFDSHDMLWKYKWILASLSEFPQLTRPQIDAAAQDMEERCRREGYTMHAVESMRWKLALDMGEHAEMTEAYQRMRKTRRDLLSDCKACIQNCTVEYYILLGKHEMALQVADPILSGKLTCAEVPELTYGKMLIPLMQVGELDAAMALHLRGYKLVQKNPEFIHTVGEHLKFLGMTANHTKALQLIARHLPVAMTTPSLLNRLNFLNSCAFIMTALEASGKASVKLRLPPNSPFARADGVYPVSELKLELEQAARELAEQFDRRNGNTYYQTRLKNIPDLLAEVTPYPVPVRKRKSPEDEDVKDE